MTPEGHDIEYVDANDFWKTDAELKELEREVQLQADNGNVDPEPLTGGSPLTTGLEPRVWIKENGTWIEQRVGKER